MILPMHARAATIFLCLAGPVAAQSAPAERISLAGTFNNWNTDDTELRLSRRDGKYVIQRFWQCGAHEFKFVFDGSWAKHLGDAGGMAAALGGHALEQPGRNIALTIPESGEYEIWLDTAAKRWGLEPRPATKPHAILRCCAPYGQLVNFDARLSMPRAGKKIERTEWSIRPVRGGAATAIRPDEHQKPPLSAGVRVERGGQYEVSVTIDDGGMTDRETMVLELGTGFVLQRSFPALEKDATHELAPISNGQWAAVVDCPHDGPVILSVEPTCKSENEAFNGPQLTTSGQAGRRYLALYEAQANRLRWLPDGWHLFRYAPDSANGLPKGVRVERVDLAGDFTGWQTAPLPLICNADAREFGRIVLLPDGVHGYKYLVNGVTWVEDPLADPKLRRPNEYGQFNSGVRIGDDPTAFGAVRPDHITAPALKHEPQRPEYFTPVADGIARLVVRALTDDVRSADLLLSDANAPVPMTLARSAGGFDYWSAQVPIDRPELRYAFRLCDGPSACILDERGVSEDANGSPTGLKPVAHDYFEQTIDMAFKTPDWAKKAVWYQIFPERFRNGDASNDPPHTVPWTHEWYKPYKGKGSAGDAIQEKGSFYSYIYNRRYGGDLQGVREKLPYLRDLGVTAIYFNPIFLAESVHKYDASDYRHIDDFFGVKDSLKKVHGETTDPRTWKWSETDRVFLDFLNEAHRQGFKVVLDGVFNHTGRDFWAFRDILKHGKKSKFVDWFDIESWDPFHYRAWDKPDGALPRLKHDDALGLSEPVREHLFAVTRRWMDPNGDGDPSDGIDGWRLDVAGDINANFWRDWRKLVKSINPDAYIVGELWQESKQWLDGTMFDAVMNYPFAVRCQRFFVNQKKAVTPSEFRDQLEEILAWYKPQVNYVLQNLFDSHDTDRVASMFMNPDLEYDQANRIQDNGPKYDPSRPTAACYQKLKLMVVMQMTYLGAPMVYYGGEVGMYGADDPSDRKPMLWADLMPYDDRDEKVMPDVFEHYRRMIAIRNSYKCLQLGSYQALLADDAHEVFAFSRSLGRESVVVVLNNSDKQHRLKVPVPWKKSDAIVRLDDPEDCEMVAASKETERATVRPTGKHAGKYHVDDGHLHGALMPPRSWAIFALAK